MTDERSRGVGLLFLYPHSLVVDAVDDDGFRAAIGLKLDGILSVDQDRAIFKRPAFFDAVRGLYAGTATTSEVVDETGRSWVLATGDCDGVPVLTIVADDDRLALPDLLWLHPSAERRLARLDRGLAEAGLPATELADWRARLAERALDNDEVRHLDATLADSPVQIMGQLEQQLRGTEGRITTLAPDKRAYYERLIGPGVATDLADLAASIIGPFVERLLTTEPGARNALLLGGHPTLLPQGALTALPEADLERLLDWAHSAGDILSQVAAIEVGLAALDRVPALEAPLMALIIRIRDEDPDDPAGRLQLLMATLLYVAGELARTKVLDDLPPFQRRLAIMAQAAIFCRAAQGRIGVAHFADWAMNQRMQLFYYQALIELRREPRWLPDYFATQQLKAECIGRIHNAAGQYATRIGEGPLRDLLFGTGTCAIPAHLDFPASFLPGPLEGAANGIQMPLSPEWAGMIDEALASSELELKSLAGLINLRGLFAIENDRVDRAVDLIRSAGHRFPPDVDQDTREAVFSGLAALAASTRNTSLADELRTMVRKNRVDGDSPPSPDRELRIALMAGAAQAELGPWCDFVGDWAAELAFGINDKAAAFHLLAGLKSLRLVEPFLNRRLGGPIAALMAFLGNANG